jgi:hypothetical protein
VRPSAFRSRIESIAPTAAWRTVKDARVLKPGPCPKETAEALLDCREGRDLLSVVNGIVGCPLIVEAGEGIEIVGKGYHAGTGLLIAEGKVPPELSLSEAVTLLSELVADFAFADAGDRTRALAAFLTPALKLGGFIRGTVPVDVAEADKSQAGKGYRHKLVAAVYNEMPATVARRDGGVGGMDESLAARLVAGRPFIQLDNLRGRLASEYLESMLTAERSVPCRLPGLREVSVDPSRFFIQLTSNGVETTEDFANRSSIVRIRKRPAGYTFHAHPEGDLLAHLRSNQPRYLGAVFSIIREWVKLGKPRVAGVEHDFRDWGQTLAGIMRAAFPAEAPLMQGHRAAQERVSNPALTFLRAVGLAIVDAGRGGEAFHASGLYELAAELGVAVPGMREPDQEDGPRLVGKVLARVFREGGEIEVDRLRVKRAEVEEKNAAGNYYQAKTYTFSTLSP